jgi:hypothetical protein
MSSPFWVLLCGLFLKCLLLLLLMLMLQSLS